MPGSATAARRVKYDWPAGGAGRPVGTASARTTTAGATLLTVTLAAAVSWGDTRAIDPPNVVGRKSLRASPVEALYRRTYPES